MSFAANQSQKGKKRLKTNSSKHAMPSIYKQEQDFLIDQEDPQYCSKDISRENTDRQNLRSIIPPISEIINYRFKQEDRELHEKVISIARYAQDLENMVQYKNREIEKLQYMIKYLTIAQQKRDEMLSFVQEENRKLKEQNQLLQNQKNNQNYVSQKIKSTNNSISIQKNNHHHHNNNSKKQASHKSSKNNTVHFQDKQPPYNLQLDTQSQQHTQRSSQSKQDYAVLIKQNTLRSPTSMTTPKNFVYGENSRGEKVKFSTIMKDDVIQEENLKQSQKMLRTKENVFEDKPQSILAIPLDANVDQYYEYKEHIQILKEIMTDEEIFIQTVKNTEFLGMLSIYDAVNKIQNEHYQLFSIVFRLRKLLKSAISMSSSMTITEALQKMVEEICGCLESDRASVFIFDHESETLWTKVNKQQKKITIPFNMGLVGHAFTTGETLNIMNAYNDNRFNKDVDKALNYKTNTVLVVPVKDNNNIIGVIQAVNKMQGYFTKDDESLLKLIAQLSSIVLRNSLQYDENVSYHNNLRSILRSGVFLSQFLDLKTLLIEASKVLKESFNVQKGQIFVIDKANQQLIRYNEETEEKETFPMDLGIVGQTVQKQDIINVPSAYNDVHYNELIDLNTQMPIISMPVREISHQHKSQTNIFDGNYKGEFIAIIQIINGRGIQGLSSTNKSKITAVDYEYIEFFGRQISQQIENALYLQGKNVHIDQPDSRDKNAAYNINVQKQQNSQQQTQESQPNNNNNQDNSQKQKENEQQNKQQQNKQNDTQQQQQN